MLVVNSNSTNVMPTSGENIFDTWYPDFKQLLFIPFLGVHNMSDISGMPTLTISNKTVNFIATPISQIQSISINSAAQNTIGNTNTSTNSFECVFTSVLLGQFKGGEIVGKKCYAIVRSLVNGGVSTGSSTGSPVIGFSLLHTDGTETTIGSMTCAKGGDGIYQGYLETAGQVATQGDRLLMSFSGFNIYRNINSRFHALRFGDNCGSAAGPMTPIQVSVD